MAFAAVSNTLSLNPFQFPSLCLSIHCRVASFQAKLMTTVRKFSVWCLVGAIENAFSFSNFYTKWLSEYQINDNGDFSTDLIFKSHFIQMQ